MQDRGESGQGQALRNMERMESHDHIDVTSAVMRKVHQYEGRRKSDLRAGTRRRMALIASFCAVVLLSSITVYAGTRFIEIRNHEGKIVITSIAQQSNPYANYYINVLDKYEAELKKKLKPGEMAAYYVKDKQIQAAETLNPVHFLYVPYMHRSYDELSKEMQTTDTPQIQEPTYMPKGYLFDTGSIQAKPEPFAGTPEYEQLLAELKAMAEKSTDEQALFYKMIPPTKGASSMIRYRKGDHQINIVAFSKPTNSTVQVPSGNAEKLVVNGKEMLLSSPESGSAATYTRILTWLDATGHVLYNITDDAKDPLSKEEFAKIAAGIMGE
ncbi:hypothetical protein J23TS9_14860 [Paenibacillus sp. J23TS9]|uniref:hypothetical protein n=1 Tax=Paenibacillus sp. J23TS9 TaxID=2807193 RepID=UPI001AFDBB6A|nr:hypothetical protein [Paenibacillus sp. J23TS9]GIP26356.1 hypothetical protein J23TS9_14860 [Paenibacillus sp. J23TS9]